MTQPSAPAAPATTAPPAPTSTQPAPAPSGTQPAVQQPQPTAAGWAPTGQPYQPPAAPPVQYVPVMPIPPTVAAPATPDNGSADQDLSKLPQWVQKQITDLRDENAKRRVSERTAVVNQHAWMAAQQLGANASAVLGSLAWQEAAKGLDPSSADFGRHLAEAIHRTVTQNPWMAAPPVPGQGWPGVPGQPPQQTGPSLGSGTPTLPGVPPQSDPGGPVPAPGPITAPPYSPYPAQPGYGMPPGWPPASPGYPGTPPSWPAPGWPQPPAPPTSGADFTGTGGAGAPITEAQLAQMAPEQIAEAMQAGRLTHLM